MGSDDNRVPGSKRGLLRARQASGRVALPVKALLIWLALLLLVPGLTGCGSIGPAPVDDRNLFGPAPAGYYRVRKGDTLHAIAARRGLNYRTLARWNKISSPYRIYAGKLLRVSSPSGHTASSGRTKSKVAAAKKSSSGKSARASSSRTGKTAKASRSSKAASSGLRWRWPLKGKVVQRFRRGDRTHQGVRIAGRAGQKVAAAEGGEVVYSGSGLKGYGNLIIVKHNNKYLSAYGFNRRLLVSEGERVKRGQSVAEVGQASSGEYVLHFEIRRSGTAVDPLRYLPGS